MAFKLDQFDVMEYLWDTLDKSPDGDHITYTEMDIDQLWQMGFVDSKRITPKEWRAVFAPLRQSDGTFLISKADFIALDRYRYKGEIRVPFDAMLINEGKYTDDGLQDLIDASIAPSCGLNQSDLQKYFTKLKKTYRQPDGLILIKKPAKQEIQKLLAESPSPLRNLELLMDEMLRSKSGEMKGEVDSAHREAQVMQAAMQASSFSATPTTTLEKKAQDLKALQKARKKPHEAQEIEGKPKTELKKIRRSRKGMRG